MLLRCIRAENRKLRGSAIWLVFFVVPLISCLYGTVNFLGNQGMLSFTWYDLWTQHTLFYALFFFAPMVGVYAAYLWRLEHLGRNWNLIMSAPVRPLYLFAAKALALIKLVAFTQGWVFLLFLLCGRLWARLPGWPPAQIFLWLLRGVAGSLPIVALELGLAMAIRSFAVPVLLGLAGGVSGMLIASKGGTRAGLFWPYSLMQMGMNSNKAEDGLAGSAPVFWAACLVWTAVFFAAAALWLRARDVEA